MSQLKAALQALAVQAKANNIHRMAEMQVQSDYVLKVLEALGWKSSDWALGSNIGANTGTFSDILLHDSKKHPVLVVECTARQLTPAFAKLQTRGTKTSEKEEIG